MFGEINPKAKTIGAPQYPPGLTTAPIRIATGLNPGYIFALPQSSVIATLGASQSRLYVYPWICPNDLTLLDVGIDLAGQVGSAVIRQGIYYDNGNCYPGSLMQDFGNNSSGTTINGNQVAGVYFLGGLTQPLYIPAGFYWLAIVSQGAAASLKAINLVPYPYNYVVLNAAPTTGESVYEYCQNSVTGALPIVFTTTKTIATEAYARIILKIA